MIVSPYAIAYTDRRIRKQRKKLASAPGEWYRELPEEQKPHRTPEWLGTEMAPGDAHALMLEAESHERARRSGYSSDRRGQGWGRQRPPTSGGRPRPEQRR